MITTLTIRKANIIIYLNVKELMISKTKSNFHHSSMILYSYFPIILLKIISIPLLHVPLIAHLYSFFLTLLLHFFKTKINSVKIN